MEQIGGAQKELGQFSESDWKKCGEIKLCHEENVFAFSCIHCNETFFQIAIFAQHLRWKHLAEDKLKSKPLQRADNLNSFTVEELLNATDGSTNNESSEGTSTTDEDAATATTMEEEEEEEEENDTGLGSDEELEKEIQELLKSIASNDCSSNYEAECSENDSGFESTNRQTNRYSQGENVSKHTTAKEAHKCGSEILNKAETLDIKTIPQKETNGRKDESGINLEATKKERSQTIADDKFTGCIKNLNQSKVYTKETTKSEVKMKDTNSKRKLNIQNRSSAKIKNKIPLKKYLKTNKFLFDNIDTNPKESILKAKENKTDVNDQHVKTNKEIQQQLDTVQSTGKLGSILEVAPHTQSAEAATTTVEASSNIVIIPRTDDKNEQLIESARLINKCIEIGNEKDSANTVITDEKDTNSLLTVNDDLILQPEIAKENVTVCDNLKSNKCSSTELETEGKVYTIEKMKNEESIQYNFSDFQREYIIYNEINENGILYEKSLEAERKCIAPTIDNNEKPLDLSFNKSTELTDMQFEEISELLSTNALHAQTTTEMIVKEFDKLLDQQTNVSIKPTMFLESKQLQNSESIGENQLPSFSEFFKNNANSLKTTNGCMAQSTPKQKTALQMKTIKRVSQQNLMKETKLKKCKKQKANCIENSTETKTTQKPGIEILSVDILLPSESTTPQPLNLHNSNANTIDSREDKPITEGCDNSELTHAEVVGVVENNADERTSGSIIEDLIPYVKIKKPTVAESTCGAHVAADSTSEQQPMAFLNEIDYTPEDTLNQLKLEAMVDEKQLFHSTMQNSVNLTASFTSDCHNSTNDESMLSTASDEDWENYKLLRSIGLQIILDPNVEDDLCLEKVEEMRAKANTFAKIHYKFKYLWKFGRGVKSYEQLELDFNNLMQRLNEHYKFELTIAQTKRIVNLISLWYMQIYHRWFIEKKRASTPVLYYLQTFAYLPKTARRIFYCEDCPRYFLTQQKYSAHRQGHVDVSSICATCQTKCASRSELQMHAKHCVTFICIECGCEFENAADLEYHLRNNHMFQCEKCGKLCATAADLDWHEHEYPIICGLCNRFFDTALKLQKHRQDSFHWDYTCRTCEVFLPTATLMKQHLKLCNGNTNACPI